MDYCSTAALQQIIGAPSVSSYISEIETEVGRRAREQKGLGWIKKGENYVMVQFISIRTCQELPDNSSGWVDSVIKYVKWEPNKFPSYIFGMTAGKLFIAQESDKLSLCSCTEVKTATAAFWKESETAVKKYKLLQFGCFFCLMDASAYIYHCYFNFNILHIAVFGINAKHLCQMPSISDATWFTSTKWHFTP